MFIDDGTPDSEVYRAMLSALIQPNAVKQQRFTVQVDDPKQTATAAKEFLK